jgi:hypothetical protein
MSGTTIRVIDLPDLGTVTDASSIVADKTGTGRFSSLAFRTYCLSASLPEAPSNNTPYGRMNGSWTPVLPDAPSNGVPFGRLNAAWAAVVPEAPLTGTVYGRWNGQWAAALPASGGSITGNLNVSGNVGASNVYTNTLNLASSNSYEWDFNIQSGTGDHVQQHRAGWADVWESATGRRRWSSTAGTQMTLDSVGDLVTAGYVNASQFWSSAGAVGQFGFAAGGSGRIFQFSTSFYLDFSTGTGTTAATLQWVVSNGPLWVMRASDDFCFNPQAAVGGNGAYVNSSDRRAKTKIAPSGKGLAEVLQLQPVSFERTNPATPAGAPLEIGFIAQDVQPIVPEAVRQAGIPLRDGTGGIDSAEPTLGLTSETITAISVNAIKELNALIATLTNRVAALEAAA